MSKYNSSQGILKIGELVSKKDAKIHFVGVGGVGMYSLLILTASLGISVSGSDKKYSERLKALCEKGYDVRCGCYTEAVPVSNIVVYSLAVAEDDPELRLAEELGIMLVSRAEYLSYLLLEYKTKISVSGSHGKSSSCAMLASVLINAQLSPTAICGAAIDKESGPCIVGSKELAVFEACEYKDSFLHFSPDISLITNIELDHTDYFSSLDDVKRSFLSYMNKAAINIVNTDDENIASLVDKTSSEIISYGLSEHCDFRADFIEFNGKGYSFYVLKNGERVGFIRLSVPGRFSVYNALGVFAAAYTLGIDASIISSSLSDYCGIERRFELIGKRKDGAPIIFDYAHHPSEIKATLLALREIWSGKINVVFKPHTYSRTKDLWDGFVEALMSCDSVLLSEIDAIRESEISGVSAQGLADAIGDNALSLSDEEIVSYIKKTSGAVLIMGAADLEKIKTELSGYNIF